LIVRSILVHGFSPEYAASLGPEKLDYRMSALSHSSPGRTGGKPAMSPSCASFDQYRNFEIPGAAFRELVTALPGVKPVV
jgi:UDP-N-acetylmuramoylalanine--D-glutamate ligase